MTEEVKHCKACEAGVRPLTTEEVNGGISQYEGWTYDEENKRLRKAFQFKGFNKTMSFVNAVAWIANQEKHHPDLEVSFNCCIVNYQTHAIEGISENDLICVEKVEALLK
jgi:4a-hydroxytetrahydrobiopterin dehydratase